MYFSQSILCTFFSDLMRLDLARAHATLTGREIANYADWTRTLEPDNKAGHAARNVASNH